jgi:hypothetical protein
MKFCRNCGTVLQAAPGGMPPQPQHPMMPGPMPGPMGGPMGGGMPGMGGPMPGGMHGGGMGGPPGGMPPMGQPMGQPMGAPPPMAQPRPGGPAPMGGPGAMGGGMGGMPPMGPSGVVAGSIGGSPSGPSPIGGPGSMGGAGMGGMGGAPGMGGMPPMAAPAATPIACTRCGSAIQTGFAFCQQCGQKVGAAPSPGAPVDALAGTLATSGPISDALRAGAMAPRAAAPAAPAVGNAALAPTPAAGAWGSAVSVNRDGSDGDRFPLAGEFVVVGRAGADISFDQDRFLARQHARLEPTPDGAARIVPIDTLNGVFRKIDGPVVLEDGMTVLAGREVLRYETVDADEKAPTPLIRHGVALFGSPPREPWARLSQMLPSGGVRDVRHLWDDEVVIGREDGDLVFSDDQFLSRRHCSIAWDGTRATLNDLGSSNGTFIRLAGPTAVKNGDHLRLGDQLFRIELRR